MNTTAENLTYEEWRAVLKALHKNAWPRLGSVDQEEPHDACYASGPTKDEAYDVGAFVRASSEGWVLLWPLSLNNTKRQAKLLARHLPGTPHSRWLERLARWYGYQSYKDLLDSVTRAPGSVWRTL